MSTALVTLEFHRIYWFLAGKQQNIQIKRIYNIRHRVE